ncbi:hypothetical protein LEP48_04000 [Isoptericola sp. NEAU-Y5]|uniref:Lipoprotein n=1 Tax=Isoptericola luteus TaxID=2879484 RepID=A0ABS7ZBT8_9MICO|nr:hypothetical protein [Isoptericola sp. NEAU-Y5]MCA5892516.1 hypothetical protein [Isoptericola sp. NEAU-Y5]
MHRTVRAAAVGMALTLPFAVGACGGPADEAVSPLAGTSSDPAPTGDAGSEDVAADAAAVDVARVVDAITERTVAHRAADVTVLGGEVSYETPDTWVDDGAEPVLGEVLHLYLEVEVANRLLNTGLLLQDGIYLDLGTGEPVENVVRTDATGNIADGAVAEGWYGFELPAADVDLDQAALVLGELDRRKDRLPLSGEVPAPEYPRAVTVDSPGRIQVWPGDGTCPMDVEITGATLAHWFGFDEDGRSSETDQAAADSLMLRIDLDASVPVGPGSCFIGAVDDVRLVIDGDRRGDIPQLENTNNVAGGTTEPEYLIYEIPADAEVEIEWGRLDGETVRTAVPLP